MTTRTITAGSLRLDLQFKQNKLCAVSLPEWIPANLTSNDLRQAAEELSGFELFLDGVPEFTRKAWNRMQQIQPGDVITYQRLAMEIGHPGAARAAGMACAANPLLLVIPCHRVVAKKGFGGFRLGLPWKEKLLQLERENPFPSRQFSIQSPAHGC